MRVILRVGTYPTDVFKSVGLHGYKISSLTLYKTVYISPAIQGNPLPAPSGCELKTVKIYNTPTPSDCSQIFLWLHTIRRCLGLLKLFVWCLFALLLKHVDMVHIHSPMYLPVALISRLLRKRIFITFHGSDFYRIKDSSLYAKCAGVFDAVFCISSAMREDLQRIHPCPVYTVSNGIDRSLYVDQHLQRKRQILAVGTLKKEKGYSYLIEAFAELCSNNRIHKDYEMLIVGDGLLRRALEELTEKLHMQDRIRFAGTLELSMVVKEYNESEVFVLSSVSEGFPKVILEALSCGCKIVSTRVGEVPCVLGEDYQYLANPCDVEGLANAIEGIIKNNVDIDRYNDIMKSYSWNNVQEQYTNVYNKF